MEPKGLNRKFTAILSAYVAGYSRLMQDDEAATVNTLESYKQAYFDLIKQHRGRVVDSRGDNLLSGQKDSLKSVREVVNAQMDNGTEEDVENRVKEVIRKLGANGRLVITPAFCMPC